MNSSDSWTGRLIGENKRYRLEKRLGGGGMGDVYQAIDMRVGQEVALKLLKGTLVASEEMRRRFEREIAVCAALPNEHIVKIIDAGVIEGFPFYVMEYLRGKTLRELLLKERRLTIERSIAITTQVCQGLQQAHEGVTLWQDGAKTSEHTRVVHRDLKPDNIFIIPTELGEWVKILDFGIAKIRNESTEQTNFTSRFIGTFRYAAPEQLKNDRDLDGRADIYSLGIILYEMLSAADPFGFGIKPRSVSEASWILAHTSEAPKSLRSQPGCEQLSPELEAVVIRCLQKNPADRFATVKELNQTLQAVINYTTKGHQIKIGSQPRQQEGSNDETIPRLLEMKGSDKETVPLPLEAEDFKSQTAARPSQTEQSKNQTITRPIKPDGEGDEGQTPPQQSLSPENREETLFQQQPPQSLSPENREETLFQQQPPQLLSPENREETLFQQQPPQSLSPENREETLFQQQPPQSLSPENREETLFQQQPPQSLSPENREETLFQQQPPQSLSPQNREETLFQQQPPQPLSPENREETLFQQQPPQPLSPQNREETLFQQQPPQPLSPQNREETLFQQQTASGQNLESTLFEPQPPSKPNNKNAVKKRNGQQNAGQQREARKLPMNLAIVIGVGIGLVVVGGIAYTLLQSRKTVDKKQQGNYQERIFKSELIPIDSNLYIVLIQRL